MDLISVIVPIYNCKNTISRCIESILNQSYENLEILLIDDDSTDGSDSIAKSYCSSYPSIRYYHQTHKGVSAARNLGLKYSLGKYISFVDSDDYLETDMYLYTYEAIITDESDCCIYGYYTDLEDFSKEASAFSPSKINSVETLRNIFPEKGYGGFIWNKLFRKDSLETIFFDEEVAFCEDLLFQVRLLAHKNLKVCVIDKVLYHYNKTGNSVTKTDKLIRDSHFVYEKAFDKIKTIINNSSLDKESLSVISQLACIKYLNILDYSIYCLLNCYLRESDIRKKNQYRDEINILKKTIKKEPRKALSLRQRLHMFILGHCPIIYAYLRLQ